MSKEFDQLREDLGHLYRQTKWGCGNHGCRILPLRMGTNSVCQCSPKRLAARLLDIAAELEKLTVDKLRVDG